MNDILDVTRLEAGALDLELVWFDVRGLLSELASSAERAVALGGNILRLEIDEGVVDMRGDPARVRQILANLLSNAAKFTENGEIVLSVAPAPEGNLRFEVRDSGVGMDASQLAGIFDPFVQTDPGSPKTHGGLGLGLTIVGLLAEQMGGEVSVASERGVGSTFTLVVPHHGDTRAPAPEQEDKGDASEEAR
jgi:signal transduction histidine kinase